MMNTIFRSKNLISVIWAVTTLSAPVPDLIAQGTKADYQRFQELRDLTRNKLVMPKVIPHWFDEGRQFWYRRDLSNRERNFVRVNAVAGKRMAAFDHDRLAAVLSKALNRKVDAARLPIDEINFENLKERMTFRGPVGKWHCNLSDYAIEKINLEAGGSSQFRDTVRSSRMGGEAIHVTIRNQSNRSLELLWVGANGGRKSYGTLAPGKARRQHTFQNHIWIFRDRKSGRSAIFEASRDGDEVNIADTDLKAPGKDPTGKSDVQKAARRSPDGKWEIQIKVHNVFLRRLGDETRESESQLTKEGIDRNGYIDRVFWAPDSTRFVILKRKEAQEHTINTVESSPEDQVQPKLKSFQYLKPGDEITMVRPHLFAVAGGKPREVKVPDNLFKNPWSVSDLQWLPDSSEFCFFFNQRGHQVLRIVAVDAKTGKTRAVIEEKSPTFIDYAGKRFSQFLKDSNEWIWMSERDGWNHLYLYDVASGEVRNQITKGPWVVRGVDRVDVENRQIWFRAGGIYPKQDPYHVHFCRIDFDGSNLVKLTGADGTHSIDYSPDGKYLITTHSRVDSPTSLELRRVSDGKKLCDLEKADWSDLLKTSWQIPERFVAKGRDGKTDIHGVIYRPTTFDPGKQYAVIEKIYAGPHGSFVPKEFKSYQSAQALAELGFIVVQIDGMGTSHRSKAFHDVAWKNLKDSGFPDRILWMKAAAKKYPWMDLSRVGIYGGSAGGQSSTAALLWHGNFYQVAVSDCGCHDNRMDKIWWNELWMGWPVDESYQESSNVENAGRLQGHLLLTVGELDRNVDPTSTMQVVDALIREGKDFDMIVVPGAGHGVGDSSAYMRRRRADYFVRHLLGVEPRSR